MGRPSVSMDHLVAHEVTRRFRVYAEAFRPVLAAQEKADKELLKSADESGEDSSEEESVALTPGGGPFRAFIALSDGSGSKDWRELAVLYNALSVEEREV